MNHAQRVDWELEFRRRLAREEASAIHTRRRMRLRHWLRRERARRWLLAASVTWATVWYYVGRLVSWWETWRKR